VSVAVSSRWGRGLERVVTATLLLLLALGGTITLLLATQLVVPADLVAPGQLAAPLLGDLGALARRNPEIAGLGGAALGLGCLLLLVMRMNGRTSGRRRARQHLLEVDDEGFVMVDSRGVGVIAAQAGSRARGVIDCAVQVFDEGTAAVSVETDVYVSPGTSVKSSAQEVRASVRGAIERLIGLEVRQVAVKIHVLEPEAMTRAVW